MNFSLEAFRLFNIHSYIISTYIKSSNLIEFSFKSIDFLCTHFRLIANMSQIVLQHDDPGLCYKCRYV